MRERPSHSDGPRQSGGSTQIASLTGYEPKTVEFKDIDAEAIEPVDVEPRRNELDRNLGTDPCQIQERFMRNNYQNPTAEGMDEFGKVGADVSYFRSQMHSENDSAKSIADSDLEDGEQRKMLASPLKMQSREDCESSCMPIARGKPAATFSLGSKQPGNQFKSSVFKHADPSNLGRSLLEGNKDHLLSQARSELMKQEHQVGSLKSSIIELHQQAYAQRLELQDAQHGYVESRREHVRPQEDYL